jgi:hypothetical protein
MSPELVELIRIKSHNFSTTQQSDLLSIANSSTWLEDLLDYIIQNGSSNELEKITEERDELHSIINRIQNIIRGI